MKVARFVICIITLPPVSSKRVPTEHARWERGSELLFVCSPFLAVVLSISASQPPPPPKPPPQPPKPNTPPPHTQFAGEAAPGFRVGVWGGGRGPMGALPTPRATDPRVWHPGGGDGDKKKAAGSPGDGRVVPGGGGAGAQYLGDSRGAQLALLPPAQVAPGAGGAARARSAGQGPGVREAAACLPSLLPLWRSRGGRRGAGLGGKKRLEKIKLLFTTDSRPDEKKKKTTQHQTLTQITQLNVSSRR